MNDLHKLLSYYKKYNLIPSDHITIIHCIFYAPKTLTSIYYCVRMLLRHIDRFYITKFLLIFFIQNMVLISSRRYIILNSFTVNNYCTTIILFYCSVSNFLTLFYSIFRPVYTYLLLHIIILF